MLPPSMPSRQRCSPHAASHDGLQTVTAWKRFGCSPYASVWYACVNACISDSSAVRLTSCMQHHTRDASSRPSAGDQQAKISASVLACDMLLLYSTACNMRQHKHALRTWIVGYESGCREPAPHLACHSRTRQYRQLQAVREIGRQKWRNDACAGLQVTRGSRERRTSIATAVVDSRSQRCSISHHQHHHWTTAASLDQPL